MRDLVMTVARWVNDPMLPSSLKQEPLSPPRKAKRRAVFGICHRVILSSDAKEEPSSSLGFTVIGRGARYTAGVTNGVVALMTREAWQGTVCAHPHNTGSGAPERHYYYYYGLHLTTFWSPPRPPLGPISLRYVYADLLPHHRLNYTALRLEIDNELERISKREGRLLGESRLPKFLSNLGRFLDFEQVVKEIETSIMSSMSCNACKAGVGLLQHYVQNGKTREDIIKAASKLCMSFKIETPRVCMGIIYLMAEGMPTLKVLHLSDTHFDPEYREGSNADCGEPLCCRANSGPVKSPDKRAGLWGDFRKCDTPLRTIESMLDNIAYLHPDIDYIIWTGDLPPHDIWNQTRESNLNVVRATVQQLVDYFPYTPIFPALGNHEAAPVNSFPPPFIMGDYGVSWLYDELDHQWQRWLPQSTSPTVRKGAFYSVLELQWFIYELQGAEDRGEKVHILGHIPPGHHDCLKVWSHNYYTIINRFESTITAQFFGHTHYDEFELFYDEYNRHRVTNIAYIGPSVTSYYKLNPGYRIYTIEGDYTGSRKLVMDHETWVMNLDEANRDGVPRWYQLYSAQRAYNMRNLLPQEWNSLVYKMALEDELFEKYLRFYWKNSVAREECDAECKKRMLCDLKSGRSNDRKHTCAKINEQMELRERNDWRNWIFSGLTITSLAVAVPVAAIAIPKLIFFFFL
ncbi:Sphingomyelin phosphodiesterase-like 2 [Homarus americanus]|uniref:Sphingomyelin phosphodiesterase-like 2 n=1 Tax=Homarus americanus TaxID=6706 RepID=A0A8J5J8L7_HOMAM|nr:Sphingomyelin phosphodiesterase-like 2 [Homarus americanus]